MTYEYRISVFSDVISDLSGPKLIASIKSATLNNSEIQSLIDTLLNKQSDRTDEWTKVSVDKSSK